jgi:hypothetical protein
LVCFPVFQVNIVVFDQCKPQAVGRSDRFSIGFIFALGPITVVWFFYRALFGKCVLSQLAFPGVAFQFECDFFLVVAKRKLGKL